MSKIWPKISRILLFITCHSFHLAYAASLKTNEFATLKFTQVNARTGPSKDCPIVWEYLTKGEPVFLEQYFEGWFKIKDVTGEGGWIHRSLLSANRSIVITSTKKQPLYRSDNTSSKIIAYLAPQLRCTLLKDSPGWCKVRCYNYKGWIGKSHIWGVAN